MGRATVATPEGVWYCWGTFPREVILVDPIRRGEPSVSKRPRTSSVAATPAWLSAGRIASSASSIEALEGTSIGTVKAESERWTIVAAIGVGSGCGDRDRFGA